MDNNDILIRLRYALDIKDRDLVKIFKKGDVDVSFEEVLRLLTKTEESDNDNSDESEGVKSMECTNFLLESFLNGLIVEKRGV